MPYGFLVTDARDGKISHTVPIGGVIQGAPAGITDYAPWYALENSRYEYVSDGGLYFPGMENRVNDSFAYATDLGPASRGLREHSARITYPYSPANHWSGWTNPNRIAFPGSAAYLKSAIDLIPADGYISSYNYRVQYSFEPDLEWYYELAEFDHDNTLLPHPAPGDMTGRTLVNSTLLGGFEGGYYGSLYKSYLIDPQLYPELPYINARDCILQDFNLWSTIKWVSGDGAPSVTPVMRLHYIRLEIYWRGQITCRSIDGFNGAYFQFGMGAAGDVERNRILAGALDANLSGSGGLLLIGNLVGDFGADQTNLVDATNNYGGVDTGIHNTGYFNAGVSLDAEVKGHLRLDSDAGFEMSMSLAADINAVRNLIGNFSPVVNIEQGLMIKDGSLVVEPDDFFMSMTLSNSTTLGGLALVGAYNCNMALTADLVGQIQLSGSMIADMSPAATIARSLSIAGTFGASMDGVGTIVRYVDFAGTLEASLSFYAGLLRSYNEPARTEDTYLMAATDRTYRMGASENVIIMDTRKRN